MDCFSYFPVGEGDIVSQTLNVEQFHSLKLRGSSDVFLTQSNDFQVIVEGQQNIIDNIELDIQNGRWEIEFEECLVSPLHKRTYFGKTFTSARIRNDKYPGNKRAHRERITTANTINEPIKE